MNKEKDYVVWAYIVIVFGICSLISASVPLDW